jgi:hypothetical protein
MLLVNVSWNKRAASTFTVSHSVHARYVLPGGGTATPLTYSKVTVSGVTTYYRQLTSASGTDFNARSVSAKKGAYVVELTSMGFSQYQDEQALAAILNHL